MWREDDSNTLCHGQFSCRIGNRDGDERADVAWVVHIPVVQEHAGGHESSREKYGDPLCRNAGVAASICCSDGLANRDSASFSQSQIVMGSETRLGPINGAFRSSFEAAINVIGTNNETDDND